MATGMARGAAARGKLIAFGDKIRIRWGPHSKTIFRGNPNIATPGMERRNNIEWIKYYKGNRIYNRQVGDKWVWNLSFKPMPGEMFFSADELKFAEMFGSGFIILEPNVPIQKRSSVNKQWPVDRWEQVASALRDAGYKVAQFGYPNARHRLKSTTYLITPSIRHAFAMISKARMCVLHEGGLHHGAAAVGTKAVVLFGGFIPPSVTGYYSHINLTGGADACGSLSRCQHCIDAMDAITVDDVLKYTNGILTNG